MIFHITGREEWEAASARGQYSPASLATEGFIHCSTRAQLLETANTFYPSRRDLVVICIDEKKLAAPLRYEKPAAAGDRRADEEFPHLYGALNLDAVVSALPLDCRFDGSFVLPPALDRDA